VRPGTSRDGLFEEHGIGRAGVVVARQAGRRATGSLAPRSAGWARVRSSTRLTGS